MQSLHPPDPWSEEVIVSYHLSITHDCCRSLFFNLHCPSFVVEIKINIDVFVNENSLKVFIHNFSEPEIKLIKCWHDDCFRCKRRKVVQTGVLDRIYSRGIRRASDRSKAIPVSQVPAFFHDEAQCSLSPALLLRQATAFRVSSLRLSISL